LSWRRTDLSECWLIFGFWKNPVAARTNCGLVFCVGVSYDVSDAQEEQMAKKAKKKAKKM
jgi:hypothetical protein